MPTTTSVYTWVRNTSGVDKYFAFLGPNGAYLLADEDYKVAGTIEQLWAKNQIQLDAFRTARDEGTITVLKTPDVFVYDDTDEQVYVLSSDNATPVAVDPDTGSYAGDPPGS